MNNLVTNPIATIETSKGTIKLELYKDKVPKTADNFVGLAKSGFYDGLIFHRIIRGFMIQGGDPLGTGMGGSKTTIPLEIHPDLKHVDGAISMARSNDPNSASSQFFICDGAQSFLDGSYAVFGKVTEGMDVVRAIASVPVNGESPVDKVTISKITIAE